MKEKSLFQRMASLALAVVMVFSVLMVMPEKVGAADYSFNSTKSVNIPDGQDTYSVGEYAWIKYKAPSDGYLTVTAKYATALYPYSYGGWQLFSSNKSTALTVNEEFSTNYNESYYYTNNYGMKKGKTYYLRVMSQGGVTINSKFTKVAEKSGKSKSKSVSVKKGKTVKGVIPAGDKTVDWYKFKVTKKQYLKISYSAKTNAVIKMTVYNGKKSMGTITPTYKNSSTRSAYVINPDTEKKVKVDPNTYYVKVERYDNTSSGYYTLKWN